MQRLEEFKDEQELKAYTNQMLTAIKLVHDSGIIHADIKPSNFLLHRQRNDQEALGEKPTLKICDFGVSQIINSEEFGGQRKALMKERSGTAGYIAPEIRAKNLLFGPEIDIWSFGVLLY